ncbi:MAG: DNA-binding protein [Mariprofundaceae bacterium]|nr:DNA-binding protein [Mariprofundaceae bacterium]
MFTVAETETFVRQAGAYWNDEERAEFISFIASHPEAGDVIPGSGGVRKLRWRAKGKGKRGGVRVIYFNMTAEGKIWLLLIYGKNVRENIPAHVLKKVKEELAHG